ncbi:hypothetical protein CASFOL_043009 [Castilleja foliolosa]|uniref:Uncharacterized protein n=1 Tax=Castilleja foliolosa TaxID=1961234 RepID=A0ABD3B7L9_9LAMI
MGTLATEIEVGDDDWSKLSGARRWSWQGATALCGLGTTAITQQWAIYYHVRDWPAQLEERPTHGVWQVAATAFVLG